MGKIKSAINYIFTIRGSSWLMAMAFLLSLKGNDVGFIVFGLSLVCHAIEDLGCDCEYCDEEEKDD
jgi:hypothetical protein